MLKTLYTTILAAFVGLLAGPLWGQDIQKVLLHAHDNKTAIELTFLSGNRFEMQVTESQSGIHGDPKASAEVLRGSAKRVTDRMELSVDGQTRLGVARGDGPVDAAFNAVKMLYPHGAHLQLYQVQAVTEGTDAQATVFVRLEEDGRIATGTSADTDTVVASVKAYVHALNRLIQRRQKSAPDSDVKTISYKQ